MNSLNELLQKLGVSKVRLAKYLGVSRQMVYNYLELNDLNKWPKEKKILLFKLLDLDDSDSSGGVKDDILTDIKITTDYLMAVENRLNQGVKATSDFNNYFDLTGLKKEEQHLISDITYFLKEKLLSNENHQINFYAIQYLYYVLQSLDNIPEIKYILGYLAKTTGFIPVDDYRFDEDRQYIFEGIFFSALNIYNNGKVDKSKIAENHRFFEREIEQRNEDKLSRTQQLKTNRIQALKELGYTEINNKNAAEFFEKIAEIESRKL